MTELLKELCALHGPSGCEDDVRSFIRARVGRYADRVIEDTIGNLLVHVKGKRHAGKNIMLASHMDEVGLIIKSVGENGYLKFGFVGAVDRRVAVGKRVLIGKNAVPGVIGIKAYHLLERGEEKKMPETAALYIDIGAADKNSALERVSPGDYAVFDSGAVEFGNGYIKSRAIDDRVGCAVLIKLIESGPEIDCWFAFTSQEEVGTRGAFGAAFALSPDVALIVEGTTAADIPSLPEHRRICAPGRGVVLPFMDSGTIYDKELLERLRALADGLNIPWQHKKYVSGGTDAAAVQRTKQGVRVAGIAAAVRYIHSPSCVMRAGDIDAIFALAGAFINSF